MADWKKCEVPKEARFAWFFRVRVDDRGTPFFTLWTREWTREGLDYYVQSGAALPLYALLNDVYWEGGI